MTLLFLVLLSCASQRLLRVEKALLTLENEALHEQLEGCALQARSPDFVARLDPDTLRGFIERVGLAAPQEALPGVFTLPIDGANTDFRIAIQLFEQEEILVISTLDYLHLDEVESSRAMVVLLTQLARLNYELLTGKFQLNVRTGNVSLSVEQRIDGGLAFSTFEAMVSHLIHTADERYPLFQAVALGHLR